MIKYKFIILLLIGLINYEAKDSRADETKQIITMNKIDTAVFGAGCFWCVEAVFQSLKGVIKVEPGFAGGALKNPTYNEVVTGNTGHAEVARVTFNRDEISFEILLSVFFKTHDPTTLNYQGADRGTQYRSAIFYNSEEQKNQAEKIISELDKLQAYPNPIVTEVTKLTTFYPAEDYHVNYYLNNQDQQYCKYVIQPKMEKFKKVFKDYLK